MEKVTPILSANKTAMTEQLSMLFGRALAGKIEITGIHTGDIQPKVKTAFFGLDDMDAATDYAEQLNSEPGRNVYVGAALRQEDVFPGKAADDSDFLRAYAVWADADDADQIDSARSAYRAAGISPPFVVVTGSVPTKRSQFWWPLETPVDNIETLRATLRGISTVLKTDPKVCTGKQLMRLAGSINWPKKDDRIMERTEVVHVSSAARQFTLEQLQRAFPPMGRAQFQDAIPDVEVAMGGALGLEEKVMDGREGYAFKLVRAHLHEYIGTTGCEPTPDDLYKSVAPVYLAKVDQVRPGRGPEFLKEKCREAIRAFEAGQIPFMRSLDEAVQTYAERRSRGESPLDEFTATTETVAPSYPSQRDPSLFEVLSIADLKSMPDAQWIVEDTIPQAGLGFVYGAPGSYKSFICYDLALSLAYGREAWIDRPIKKHTGSVLYLASEGISGAKNRIEAWQRKHELSGDAGFHLIRSSMSFLQADDVDRLDKTVAAHVEANGPVSVVFVDTVSRVLPGADENLQKDMTLFVVACDRLRERYGATVVGVHHSNKDGSSMRGSTVFLGQGDFVIRVEKSDERKGGVIICEKQKEAEDGWKRAFSVEPQEWMVEGRIKEVSSLTVAFGDAAEGREEAGLKWPPRDTSRAVQRYLNEAWMRGRPLSPYAQTAKEGRYAVRNVMREFSLPKAVVEMMLESWMISEMVVVETANTTSKMKGLKVLKWID